MRMSEGLPNALRAVAAALETPVILALLLFMAAAVFLLGSLIAELFTERRRLRAKLPELADKLRAPEADIPAVIADSGLLRRQRAALTELTRHASLTPPMREALAMRLVQAERARYENITRVSDLLAKLGPMFGLLGTLIPLGPGIIALGRGDTYTLSLSLLTAFDTTIAGLIAAAAAFVISAVRKKWYSGYMQSLEMVMTCVLEVENEKQV